MGKGSRARAQRAEDKLSNPQRYVQKKQAPKWIGTAVMILIIAVIVVSLVVNGLYDNGTFMRATTAVQTDNYTVSGTMLSYFFHSQYSSFVNNYGTLISYLGLDTSTSLKSQECTLLSDGSTWYDYFMDTTTSYVEELLQCCEYARANGIKLGDKEQAQIDEAIDSLATYAASYGYSTNGYIKAMYGSGVKESDIRSSMELVLLANLAVTHANEKLEAAITDAEIQTHFDENPESYLFADYLVKTYKTTLVEYDEDDFDTTEEYEAASADAKEKYETEKATMLAAAQEYEKLNSFEAFLDKLTEELNAEYDGYYDDNDTLTEEEKEAKEKSAIASALEASIVEGYSYQDPTAEDSDELAKWLFDDARKVGDTYLLEDEDEDAGTYSIYVYCVSAAEYREEYMTANVAYALFDAAETSAQTDAAALMEKLIAQGVITVEAFEAVADELGITNVAGNMDNLLEGNFGYDEADEFIFADERQVGDCEVMTLGSDYEAVLLYLGEGDVAWYADAKSGVLSEKIAAWYEELASTYAAERNEKAMSKISA